MGGEDSDSSSDEENKESFGQKMHRLTKLGKEGNMDELVKEAHLTDCTPEMIDFAAKKSKEMGNTAFQKKEYEQALEHYAGALVGDLPEREKIYSNRSACLFQLGKYTEALQEATKAIKTNRAWSKGYFRAGRAALEMEFYDEALELFQKGLEKEPSNKDLVTWTEKARNIRNQHNQDKLVKKHTTDYTKFDEVSKQQQEEEDEEEAANDPNRVMFGDRYYNSSKMEQRQLKAMLGYKEEPPTPFEPTFDSDLIYRHDARGTKTNHPIWDPSRREWRLDAKPAPSRVDYSDSQQTQAIAMFLERQTDVAHAEELLTRLDDDASIIGSYCDGVRDVVNQLLSQNDKSRSHFADNARWLFLGGGPVVPVMTAARYLPNAEIMLATAHRAMYIPDIIISILSHNGFGKDSNVRLIHRVTQELAIVDPNGEDINNLTGRVDIVTLGDELFDAGLIGKGVLAKVNHVKKKLVTSDHLIMPMNALISCAPGEIICPRGNGPDGLDWRAIDKCRWGAFYETMNLDESDCSEPFKSLGPVMEVFEFDFTDNEVKLSGQTDLRFVAAEDGVLNCVAFWYRMALTENVELDHCPQALKAASAEPPRGQYMRHAVQWLAAPIDVSKGDEIHIRASYSRSRIRFEVMSPEVAKVERRTAVPRWFYVRFLDEHRTDAYRKAIDKAIEKIIDARSEVPQLDRPPLRIVHLGAGPGQISMVAAKCLRKAAELADEDLDSFGYSVIAVEQMPKVIKLVREVFKDNDVDQDVMICSEDVRKLPSQPARAQLIIAELVDPGLLGEGILVLLQAARIKMCNAFDHQCIPARGTVWAAGFELGSNLKNFHGFDMTTMNHYRMGNMVDCDTMLGNGVARQMTTVFEALSFDFEKQEFASFHTEKLQPIEDGKITAIIFWYEVAMDSEGEIVLTNWPESIPPADFSMMEKDVHKPGVLRQAIWYFDGDYQKQVTKGEPIEIDIGYTQSWPQFVWPGSEMVQKESGEMIAKPPSMPRHRLQFQKMKHETEDLEKKLTHGLMFDEDMLADGYVAVERVALEPNGNPNYLIEPNNANFMHAMFFV